MQPKIQMILVFENKIVHEWSLIDLFYFDFALGGASWKDV